MHTFSSHNTHLWRQNKPVLRGISLSLQNGEVISLLGANGAGKSTFLSALAGELDAKESITLNGKSLTTMSPSLQARTRAILPQKPGLAFDLEVNEIVAMGAYPFPELSTSQISELTAMAMHRADVSALAGRRYLGLSGGEQQRVHYARAVLQLLSGFQVQNQPRYLLLDEPTASLDPLHQHAILNSVRSLAQSHRLGVLIVLHDVNLAALYSDRIALLSNGQIFACNTPDEVLTPENLYHVYGITAHIMRHPQHDSKPLVVFG